MSHAQAVPALASTAPVETPSTRHPQFRAAEIMGETLGFFEMAESCSHRARRMAVALLEAETARRRGRDARPRSRDGLGRAVLAAAVGVIAAQADGDAAEPSSNGSTAPSADPSRRAGPESASGDPHEQAGRIYLQVHGLIQQARVCRDGTSAGCDGRVADLLGHMLRGPEPRTWGTERLAFAHAVLACMKGSV